MAFIVVYDACALYGGTLRALLVELGKEGRALNLRTRWTNQILKELFLHLQENRPDLTTAQLERTRRLMCEAVPDCLVTGHEQLIENLELPEDPDDRHVLAAAIKTGAQVIVTYNLKHFPPQRLAPYDIEAQHPDDFVLSLIDLNESAVVAALEKTASMLAKSRPTYQHLLQRLADHAELTRTAERLAR